MEALVCATTLPHLAAAVIVSEDPDGRIGEIHIKSDIVGTPTAASEGERSDELERLIGLPFGDPTAAAAAQTWLTSVLPLDPDARVETSVGGVPVVLDRVARGGYLIVLGDLGVVPSALPSP